MERPSAAKSDPALANRSSGRRGRASDTQFRAVANRYDKIARNLLAAIHFAAAIIRLN
jgi:hypothetical protein